MSDRVHRQHVERLNERRQQLVTEHGWVVQHILRRYWARIVRLRCVDDARQQAQLGLVLAARTYRVEDGAFVTFAYSHCMGAVLRALASEERHLRLATTATDALIDRRREGNIFTDSEQGARDELGRHAMFTMLVITLAAAQAADESASPEERAAREQSRRQLRDAMQQIDEKFRRVLELHFFGGQPMVSVAKELDVAYPTAMRHRTAAIEALRQVLHRPDRHVA